MGISIRVIVLTYDKRCQKCENEKDAERLAGEKTEMTDKYDSLKSTLETSRSSMMQVKK